MIIAMSDSLSSVSVSAKKSKRNSSMWSTIADVFLLSDRQFRSPAFTTATDFKIVIVVRFSKQTLFVVLGTSDLQ